MDIIKKIIPKFIKIFLNIILKRKIKLIGNFNNWDEALKNSTSYKNSLIFNKNIKSFKKVLKKEAKFERDSVLFFQNSPDKKLISIIKKLYRNKKINICDFGGSLASSYFQNIDYLDKLKFNWYVIEQKKYVDFAKKNININNLNFFTNINYLSKKKIDLIIFSSVLQYLKSPFSLLDNIANKNIKNVIISRTPFFDKVDLIKIQVVPKHIYSASYPIRIFNHSKFLKFMKTRGYKIKENIPTNESIDDIDYKSHFFVKK